MSIHTRHSTAWYRALDEFVQARTAVPFAWGANDCCTFAADWVELARGTDPMADLRGLDSAAKASRAIGRLGGLLAAVTARMGAPVHGALAQVGDVALVRHGQDRLSMGVCVGEHIAAPAAGGLVMVPITAAEAAWRV